MFPAYPASPPFAKMPSLTQERIVSKPIYASLSFELNTETGVPTEAHALPSGVFRATDGRPFEVPGWQLNAAIAAKVIAKAAAQKNDILIDFEHQSLRAEDNGKPAPAAGWIPRTFEWREGSGLWATNIKWVADTEAMLVKKQYRYISTVFRYDGETGEVLEIYSLCLTNTPALDGLSPLADLNRRTNQKEQSMDDKQKIAELTVERDQKAATIAALTTERDAAKTQVTALTADRDRLQTELAALAKKEADAAALAEKEQHATLLQAALTKGSLLPAQKAWAEKQSLASLTEFLGTAETSALLNRQSVDLSHKNGVAALTMDEKAMCEKMGVSEADYAAMKFK